MHAASLRRQPLGLASYACDDDFLDRQERLLCHFAGEVSTLAGQCMSPGDQDGDATEAQFSSAIEAVACLQNCSILVTDPSSRTVRIITPDSDCPGQADNDASYYGGPIARACAKSCKCCRLRCLSIAALTIHLQAAMLIAHFSIVHDG